MHRYLMAVCGEEAAYRNPASDALAFCQRGGVLDVSSLGWPGVVTLDVRTFAALLDPTDDDASSELAFRVDRELSEADCTALADLVWARYGSRLDNPPGRGCARFIKVREWPEETNSAC